MVAYRRVAEVLAGFLDGAVIEANSLGVDKARPYKGFAKLGV
jgi:hypothetical protein